MIDNLALLAAEGKPHIAPAVSASDIRSYSLAEFLSLAIPPRKQMLSPWLPEKGLVMIYAMRGIGKTLMGLSVAYAVATGGEFLGFSAPEARRVLYVDGEMSAFDLQERLIAIERGLGKALPASEYLRILSADVQEFGLPDMATPEGLLCIDQQIGDAEVIILDNLSTLMRSGKENEAESYAMFQDWMLGHRRAGRSIVLVHHAGKSGAQRGTSKREDVLDTIMRLEQPEGYNPNEGARFNVVFTKARNFHGLDAEPFEAKYEVRDGAAQWTKRAVQPSALDKLINIPEGMSLREAEKATGVSKSTLSRRKQKGLLQTVPLSQTVADGTVGQVLLPKRVAQTPGHSAVSTGER